jgi:hypothetical protein
VFIEVGRSRLRRGREKVRTSVEKDEGSEEVPTISVTGRRRFIPNPIILSGLAYLAK